MPLLMPLPLVLGTDRTSISDGARSFIELLEVILRFGSVPYALLAALLFYRSFRWTSREMRQKLLWSPFWMIPFQYAAMVVWQGGSADWLLLLLPIAILTPIVGYFYVLLFVCLEWIQAQHGVIGPHDTVR